jgi:hypothetical protein
MRVLQYLMGQQRRFWFLMKVLFYFLDQQWWFLFDQIKVSWHY